MLRNIAGGVVGYIVVFIWTVVTMSLGWLVLGSDFAFESGTTQTTLGWSVFGIVFGFIGAVLGGWIASMVAKSPGGATALAVIILILGLIYAFVLMGVDGAALAEEALDGRSPAEIGTFEAAGVAVAPTWYNFLIGFIGALGAFLGGRLWTRKRAA